jgi:SAM-dependent methyltransferase
LGTKLLDHEEIGLHRYFFDSLGWSMNKLSSRRSFEFLLDARRFVGTGVVLDAGAGRKRFAPFFDRARYESLEHPNGINRKGMGGIQYDYVCELDHQSFPVESGRFDLVYCHSVLEHIFDIKQFLVNVKRVLKSGGRIYINVPFVYYEHEVPHDYCRYTRFGLHRHIIDSGMEVLSIEPSSNAFEGASSFLLMSLKHDLKMRGMSHDANQDYSMLEKIIDGFNDRFLDAVYDNFIPLGFLVVARKP